MLKQEILRRNPTIKGIRHKKNLELINILNSTECHIKGQDDIDFIIREEKELNKFFC